MSARTCLTAKIGDGEEGRFKFFKSTVVVKVLLKLSLNHTWIKDN